MFKRASADSDSFLPITVDLLSRINVPMGEERPLPIIVGLALADLSYFCIHFLES